MSDQDGWVRGCPDGEWRVFGITPPSLGQLVKSLTESTYTEPVAVEIEIDDDNTGNVPLKVVVTSLHAVYVGVMPMKTDATPAGCYPYPNYRFGGWLLKSGF